MIESITLRNFQKHKKLTLILGKITTIVGRSDSGKSSVVRAIRWVCLNKPGGSSLVRKGQKKCSVTLTIESVRVKRTRGPGSKNFYSADGKIQGTYRAFGSSVPKSIAEHINLSDDNFQCQLDSPYWISMTAGKVSKALNEVVDLGSIDRAVAYLNKESRKANAEVEVTRKRLHSAKKERDELASVRERNKSLKMVEQLAESAMVKWAEWESLQESLRIALESHRKAKRIRESSQRLESILGASRGLAGDAKKLRAKAAGLSAAIHDLASATAYAKSVDKKIADIKQELDSIPTCPECKRPI